MALDAADYETLGEAVYRLADWGDGPAKPSQLIRKIYGAGSARVVHNLVEEASRSRVHGQTVFVVRKSLPAEYKQHRFAHELAHDICEREGVRFETVDEEETACDRIGAAIHLRRAPFRQRLREVDADFRQLALDFQATPTSALLRIGETEETALAVISPSSVRVRGPEWFQRLVARHGRGVLRLAHPGLRHVALAERGRIAVWAVDAG